MPRGHDGFTVHVHMVCDCLTVSSELWGELCSGAGGVSAKGVQRRVQQPQGLRVLLGLCWTQFT